MAKEKNLVLKAQIRQRLGKNANRRLRLEGYIPAVFYTGSDDAVPVKVKENEFNRIYASVGRNSLITLEVEDSEPKIKRACLIWDIEHFPTVNRFLHVDFYGVDLDRILRVRVPLNFIGTPAGITDGGKLMVLHEFIYVDTKAGTLPTEIDVDVTNLELGEDIRIEDITMPEGVEAIFDDNFPVAGVHEPVVHEEILEEEAAAAEAAELEEAEEGEEGEEDGEEAGEGED